MLRSSSSGISLSSISGKFFFTSRDFSHRMQQHPSQNAPGGPHPHPPIASVTTELVQKYLDENKELILSILENQNLGNLNECAVFQQKLQSNLMFLAAVADAQTQPPPIAQQAHHRPIAMQYMSPPQAQKHMPPQPMMRNPMQYTPNEVAALQQAQLQQPQQGMHGQGGAGANVFQMNPSEAAIPMNSMMMSRGYPGGGVPEGVQTSRGSAMEMRLGNRTVLGDAGGQLASTNGTVGSGLGGEMGQPNTKPFNEGDS